MTILLVLALVAGGGFTDREERPMRPLAKPAQGTTYVDPSFGTRITRITAANPVDEGRAVIKPGYSTIPVLNADESLLLLWDRARGHMLYAGQPPYALIEPLNPWHPTDIESVLWSPTDPHVLYYPSNYNAWPWLIRHDLVHGVTVAHDFSDLCPHQWDTLLSLGSDPIWMGQGPRGLIGLRCGETAFLYSLNEDTVLFDFQSGVTAGFSRTLMVSPLEGFLLYAFSIFQQWPLEWRVDLNAANPYEHGSIGVRRDYVETWNTVDFRREATLVEHRLDTGATRVLVGKSNGYPYPPSGTHVSAVGPPGLIAVGIIGEGHGQTVLDNEILLVDSDTGVVRRVGHARTRSEYWGYWSETHVSLSRRGDRIFFASDWGGNAAGTTVDTYVIDLR